jgi:hypothetical protein
VARAISHPAVSSLAAFRKAHHAAVSAQATSDAGAVSGDSLGLGLPGAAGRAGSFFPILPGKRDHVPGKMSVAMRKSPCVARSRWLWPDFRDAVPGVSHSVVIVAFAIMRGVRS